MAQQDKTDWYWNGELAGAVNNLYYDFINVDVVHVPYATNHRNSSFFLKTRPWYCISYAWSSWTGTEWYEITDLKIIWEENCKDETWTAYAIWKKWNVKKVFACSIENWCATKFLPCWCNLSPDFYDECPDMKGIWDCEDWKLFITDYVKWIRWDGTQLLQPTWQEPLDEPWVFTWIQINKYNLWTTIWYFSDEYVESWEWAFTSRMKVWSYLLVYASSNEPEDEWNPTPSWFAWQVRMITGTEEVGGITRIVVDSPWLWFRTPTDDEIRDGKGLKKWWHVSYAVFDDWWEVVGFTDSNKIYLMTDPEDWKATRLYVQDSEINTDIISVASANDKIFILTDNWYIHYSKEWIWYNKFFIDDDMFAWTDKSSITAYRDMILAFWRRHIAIWVPDEQNRFWTMYNQSESIWVWSRYSYTEYEWDLIFVSNDKRLLALTIQSTWRYGLAFEDVWDRLNWKLSALIPWDEVFLWNDNNNLRVFVQTKPIPYVKRPSPREDSADINTTDNNTMTHIYKFDTLFKVWSEDHIEFLLRWASHWVYYWEGWVYVRKYSGQIDQDKGWCDIKWWDSISYYPYTSIINAYLIENESNWEWANSALANRPKLYQLAKLNRLITTLWPWIYSNSSKIKITTYSKWIWYTYEFPISWDWNDWVWLITDYYSDKNLDEEAEEKIECMLSTLQDSQKQYQPNCPNSQVQRWFSTQTTPWCDSYEEMITESHWICINDKLYELAPTMPLVTNLWENQDYATQIKIELIWWAGDVICFGWRLAEIFIAPIFTTWPDWEYQLQPNTDCE